MLSHGLFINTSLTWHYNFAVDIPIRGDQISPFIFLYMDIITIAMYSYMQYNN